MRSRRAQKDSTVEAADEPDQNDKKLRFNEPLSWRAGSKIPVGDLLVRLQKLAEELRGIDQEDADRDSITTPAKDLASQQLLTHKDAGVKAWTACCLVEILRVCAPEAPFTGSQLKDIFTLFIRSIIPALSEPKNSYNNQHLHVLQSLSEVKSIVLLSDVPSSNSLIVELFTNCFDVLSISSDDLSKNVEYNLTGLLQCMIDECQALPSEVIEIVMAQFLRADPQNATARSRSKKGAAILDQNQSTLTAPLPPAYRVAQNLCNTGVDRMARYISQYFGGVIMDSSSFRERDNTKSRHRGRASDAVDDSDEDGLQNPSEEDFNQLERAHRLLRELWRSSPGVLQNVIPQVEAELGAENAQLRALAAEAVGDMVSGIGAAGPPPPPNMDPTAFPYATLSDQDEHRPRSQHDLTTPSSPQSFSQSYPATYRSFLGRRLDKSAAIRSVWTTCVGRILTTDAGGTGIEPTEARSLLSQLSHMLVDTDEKVRLAAVQALSLFNFGDFVSKLGSLGGIDESNSLLHNLADRIKDRKHAVRAEAIDILAKVWGVSVGEIASGNEEVIKLLGPIPSKIFEAMYVNDSDLNMLIDKALFESLLPVGFPSLKGKEKASSSTGNQKGPKKQQSAKEMNVEEADQIRTERLLLLVRDLDQRAKQAFLSLIFRPLQLSKFVDMFVQRCEDYNGGVIDNKELEIKQHLNRLIDFLSKPFSEASRIAQDLWKFANLNDRRIYSLIKFCTSPESDYKKIHKSIREINRRMDNVSSAGTLPDTVKNLLYRISNLFYNKSHMHSILEFSQSDDKSLGSAAHELLRQISEKCPQVFKAHAEELCRALESEAPSQTEDNPSSSLSALRACSTFARKFPKDIPNDRKFLQAMVQYALLGTPPIAAKYAVTIILSSAEKKEMYAKDLLSQCLDGFSYGSPHFLSKLACISQLALLAPTEIEDNIDPIIDIAINQILLKVRTKETFDLPEWVDEPDEECQAKIWALKILVNRLRSRADPSELKDVATPVYQLLNTLVEKEGELSKKNQSPQHHRSRLRLEAAIQHLKLCSKKGFDRFLSARDFNILATVAQDSKFKVRQGFITKIKKYLAQEKISGKFYAPIFLLAFEPDERLRSDAITWVRARGVALKKAGKSTLEPTFARFLSVLAHHPDFSRSSEDLIEFVKYISFYLNAIATEDNVSLLYHIAQRMKAVEDGIDKAKSEDLYYLSDLAQAVIRQFDEIQNWSMQAFAGKFQLPAGIFAPLPSPEVAQEIASTQYLPEDVSDELESLVRKNLLSKKRKSASEITKPAKKRNADVAKTNGGNEKSMPIRKAAKAAKTPKKKATAKADETPGSERRRSARTSGRKNYAESEANSSSNDDEEDNMSVENDDDNKENEMST